MVQTIEDPRGNSALSTVRVVDLTQFNAGAACAEILAWLGADVVKVELPAGANGRYTGSDRPGIDSYEFILLNANKRSVTCDFESQRGKQELMELLANADVVVEQLAPTSADRLGFDYETVRQTNPRIVYAQIKGFAPDGPRANYLSSEIVAQAIGGIVAGTGYVGGPPLISGATIADMATALHCAIGILAALHQRQRTGRGQKIDAIMQGAVVNINRTAYWPQILHGRALERMGNTSRSSSVPSNLYACKPGGPNDHVFINISNSANSQWLGLLRALGREDLANDADFVTPQARRMRRAEIDQMVTAWCAEHTKFEAMSAIQNERAPAGAVLDARDLCEDAPLRQRGMFVAIEHSQRGTVTMPGWPVKMSDSDVPVVSAPPLGRDNEAVRREWLTQRKPRSSEQPQEHASSHDASAHRALAGVRVVDLTQLEAGPSCTEALAWLGADVVKIEEPRRGEKSRSSNTDKPGVDACYFIVFNANKRSLRCDIKSERGRELLKKLIAKADILVENLGPGVIERLGFGYDVVRELNPRLIYAQVKGFAADGPRAGYVCFDMIAQATGGSMSLTGADDGTPLKASANIGDTGAGLHCAVGILAALCQRLRTGLGQRIQVAMQESVINFCRSAFAGYLASSKPPERHGYRGLYRCKGDGTSEYCVIEADLADDELCARLFLTLGKRELTGDSRFATFEKRLQHRKDIDALLSAWCAQHTKIEGMDIMQKSGVPAGAVFDTNDLSNDPELLKCGIFGKIEHPVRGPITMPAWPVLMSDSHVPLRCPPLLGADSEAVLSEWLGLSKREMEELPFLKPAPVT